MNVTGLAGFHIEGDPSDESGGRRSYADSSQEDALNGLIKDAHFEAGI